MTLSFGRISQPPTPCAWHQSCLVCATAKKNSDGPQSKKFQWTTQSPNGTVQTLSDIQWPLNTHRTRRLRLYSNPDQQGKPPPRAKRNKTRQEPLASSIPPKGHQTTSKPGSSLGVTKKYWEQPELSEQCTTCRNTRRSLVGSMPWLISSTTRNGHCDSAKYPGKTVGNLVPEQYETKEDL